MDKNLRKQIYNNMNLRETEDLVEIWQENNREEWSDLAFNVLSEILIDRLGKLPKRDGQSRKKDVKLKDVSLSETPAKYAKNIILLRAQYSYLILFGLLIVSKGLLPDAGGGWSNPPIFDYFFFLGFGICFFLLSAVAAYYSWTLNAREFAEWNLDQIIIGKGWAKKWSKFYPDWYILWSSRIGTPIGALIGIAIFSYMLFKIISFLFG
jgi:hypothetical protein